MDIFFLIQGAASGRSLADGICSRCVRNFISKFESRRVGLGAYVI